MSTVEIRVDGVSLAVSEGATLLEACDTAGRYVPRLCYYPGLGCCAPEGFESSECGLCAVRLGDGSVVLACLTKVRPGMEVTTQDPGLTSMRSERLGRILLRHPRVCLTCADREGCARDHCPQGHAMEALCCEEFGYCELGKLVRYLDPEGTRGSMVVSTERDVVMEGKIRRESGLCIGCGRCVVVCNTSPRAGGALVMHMVYPPQGTSTADATKGLKTAQLLGPNLVSVPRLETLRASGCTFCGQCVAVCPTGALTTPGNAGARWLEGRLAAAELVRPVFPPGAWQKIRPASLATVPSEAGVLQLANREGRVLCISGVPDLRQGVHRALADPALAAAVGFMVEIHPLFTQRESELLARYAREHGQLPLGNDPTADLFDEVLFPDDI